MTHLSLTCVYLVYARHSLPVCNPPGRGALAHILPTEKVTNSLTFESVLKNGTTTAGRFSKFETNLAPIFS